MSEHTAPQPPLGTGTQRPFVLHTRVVTGTGGGPEKTILNSPRYLRDYGVDCACLFMRPPGDSGFASLERKAAAASAEIIGLDDRGPLDWRVIRDCLRICRERNVTIWHAHDYKSNAVGLLVRRFHRMHLVTTAHGWVRFTSRTPLYYWIDRFCLPRYEQVICVSEDLFQRCDEYRVPRDRLHQIDNAIVLDDYSTCPPSLQDKARFGFDSQRVLLGAVGRLSEEKGFHHLISAVSRLTAQGHPLGLIIAGDGHLRDVLQRQINDLDLQNHVRLAGFLPDPRELYRAIDLFVLSSLREGLPNVVLEAMACGRAVVTTNCNGIPRLVHHDQNGLIVPTDDESALRQAIESCLVDDQLRERLARAGRKTIEDRFCFDHRMLKVTGVYRKLSAELSAGIPVQPLRSTSLRSSASDNADNAGNVRRPAETGRLAVPR
jgi:glycosyltransferase involved in cell wall biosynthesis